LVLGYIWQFIYRNALPSIGGILTNSLISNPDTAMGALIVVITWQYAGYIMMIYIAALQNVPTDLIEASKIDGANAWQRLRTITMPLVAQAFTIAMFLTLVTSFKQYDTVMALTQGGPATTLPQFLQNIFAAPNRTVESLNLMAINIYDSAFVRYEMGVGQAKAIIFFIILLIISLTQVYYNKKKEVEL
jgi:raffinose/stachyose/melibiose transport system permease protein